MYNIISELPKYSSFFMRKADGGLNPCIAGSPNLEYATADHNCVGFACGMYSYAYWQQTGIIKMWALSCNAGDMLERAEALGLKTSRNYKDICIGSLMVFKGTKYGHIIFVADKLDDDNVLVHEDNYAGQIYFNVKRNRLKNWNYGSGLKFAGVILPEVEIKKETSRPQFKVGKIYITQFNMVVRTGGGLNYRRKIKSELTKNAQKVATSNGCIKPNVEVSCLEIKELKDQTWIRIPSGWIVGWYDNDVCLIEEK